MLEYTHLLLSEKKMQWSFEALNTSRSSYILQQHTTDFVIPNFWVVLFKLSAHTTRKLSTAYVFYTTISTISFIKLDGIETYITIVCRFQIMYFQPSI